jgi:hypothetical protein
MSCKERQDQMRRRIGVQISLAGSEIGGNKIITEK